MSLKHELQNLISGNGKVRHGEAIQAIARYLRGKKATISGIEKTKFLQKYETEVLIEYIDLHKLWYNNIDESKYIGEGAEQKIYEYSDPNYILKLNDRVFYETWEDYLHNLLIHNFFFPHLSYELLGFCQINQKLYAVVKQCFVTSTENTNLVHVKDFLAVNGFIHKKGNDYFHPDLGIILEDLHDENVLTKEGTLQFIDTVFFLTSHFFEKD